MIAVTFNVRLDKPNDPNAKVTQVVASLELCAMRRADERSNAVIGPIEVKSSTSKLTIKAERYAFKEEDCHCEFET